MIPIPVVTPLIAAPSALVVRVYTRPVRGLRIQLRRSSHAPGLVVTLKARRGRVTLRHLRAATLYVLRARSCRSAPAAGADAGPHRQQCSRWSRTVRLATLHTAELPRIAAVAGAPPMGALPALGFNDSAYADNDPNGFFADEHTLGATIARRILSWPLLEPDGSTPDFSSLEWRKLDAFVARSDAEGMRVMFEVARGYPSWARLHPLGTNISGTPTASAWKSFVSTITQRYPTLQSFGVLEPDIGSADARVPNADLAAMMNQAYPILHAAHVDAMCCGWTGQQHSGIRVVAAAEKAYGHRIVDSISLHIYPSLDGRKVGVDIASHDTRDTFNTADFADVEPFIRSKFGRRVPWALTETGWMTSGGRYGDALTPQLQAAAVLHELDSARRADGLSALVYFLVKDQHDLLGSTNLYKTGLRFADGSEKPAFSAWRDYVKAAA